MSPINPMLKKSCLCFLSRWKKSPKHMSGNPYRDMSSLYPHTSTTSSARPWRKHVIFQVLTIGAFSARHQPPPSPTNLTRRLWLVSRTYWFSTSVVALSMFLSWPLTMVFLKWKLSTVTLTWVGQTLTTRSSNFASTTLRRSLASTFLAKPELSAVSAPNASRPRETYPALTRL